ncbi:MAG: peptide chain release factor N(5)-glutamine methyltransferase [Clostridia bacterium]|nr:peptide chain release factor N(5)-glutamine methyltransferase [Clostridia bacterium]
MLKSIKINLKERRFMKIEEILKNAIRELKKNNINEPTLKAKILLSYVLNVEKEYLIIHNNEEVLSNKINTFNKYINRLINNEPIQYITAKQEFYGIEFMINKNVLIPQPDTEILVEEIISICENSILGDKNKTIHILDLCTGSGAIGIAIAKNIENCNVMLSDISREALNVANMNCKKILGGNSYFDTSNVNKKIQTIQSDLFENINDKFDIIVSNPPYIKTDVIKTLPKEVQKEPKLALDGGEDGLEIYKKIINEGYNYLNQDGYLCLEIGYDQKKEVIELLNKSKKYKDIYSKKDLAGNDRIVICKRRDK